MVERSACNCFHFTWKSTSRVMTTKVSQIASWVPMCSLLVVQHKRWTLITLMGCVHTHQRIFAIERCGNPSHLQSIMEKDGEDIRKVGKVGHAGKVG